MNATALTPQAFAEMIAPYLSAGERVAVAVSGGPDSMALAFCLLRHLQQDCFSEKRVPTPDFSKDLPGKPKKNLPPPQGGRPEGRQKLLALIVEHGLREESAAEAAMVAGRLFGMGIEAEILPWEHGEVKSRVHAQARAARYALLVEACKKRGITKLFIAHHADDQAETVLMRFAKGSGIDGLAGMDAVAQMNGVALIRPFLHTPKAALVATCQANAVPFVTDPSNENEKYARARLRRVMPLLEKEGLSPERLVDLADRAHDAKEALDYYATDFLKNHAEPSPGGAARLDIVALRGLPPAVAHRVVAAVLSDIHKGLYPPERKHLVPFVDWLRDQDNYDARTLHGCLAQKGEQCVKAIFQREPEGVTDVQTLAPGQTILWDGRWEVTSCDPSRTLEVRALGRLTHEETDRLAPGLRRLIPQGRVRASLPALWLEGRLVALPSFAKEDQGVATARCQAFSWE